MRSTLLKSISLVFILLILFVLAVIVFFIINKRGLLSKAEAQWPFYAKRPLTQPEQILYHRLVKSLPEHIVLAQVQVSRVLGVKKGFNFHEWNNRINRLSYDFVICSKDATVLAAIELDDKSHEQSGRAETDKKKEKATVAAGVQLIRWHVKSLPDQATIQALLSEQQAHPSFEPKVAGKPASATQLKR